MSLIIITPSCINSTARVEFAMKSLQSLREAIESDYPHIVVDDYPHGKTSFTKWFVDPKFRNAAESIYNHSNTTLIRRRGGGSVSATLQALRKARLRGARYVFIHLDDNVYISELKELLEYALEAFEQDSELVAVRLAGYPILWQGCTSELGNRSTITIAEDTVSFDCVCLKPSRYKGFTLWWTRFNKNMIGRIFCPINLWSTIYRADFLEDVLTFDKLARVRSLADVERLYMTPQNWRRFIERFPAKLGYINMQFGGIEMEHNKNWRELLRNPNEPVL